MPKPKKKAHDSPVADSVLVPGILARFGAIAYDFLLLLAVLFLATALLLPVNSGQAFTSEHYFYPVYLIIVSFVFYGWFWTHGGQTLGLRTWKLKLVSFNGTKVSWRLAGLRFITALLSWAVFGLGIAWCLFDKNNLCWHDYLSKTRLIPTQKKTET